MMPTRRALLLFAWAGACAPAGSTGDDTSTETGATEGGCGPESDANWEACVEQAPCVSEDADLGNPGPWIRRPLLGSFYGGSGLDVVLSSDGSRELEVVRDVFGARETSTVELEGRVFHDSAARVRLDDDDLDDLAVVTGDPSTLLSVMPSMSAAGTAVSREPCTS